MFVSGMGAAFFCRFLGGGLEAVASKSANTVERSVSEQKSEQSVLMCQRHLCR